MMRDRFSPPKKPATVRGMIFGLSFVAIGSFAFAYMLVGPTVRSNVPIRVWIIITAAVLAPGVVGAIFQQVRLRRALARKKKS